MPVNPWNSPATPRIMQEARETRPPGTSGDPITTDAAPGPALLIPKQPSCAPLIASQVSRYRQQQCKKQNRGSERAVSGPSATHDEAADRGAAGWRTR